MDLQLAVIIYRSRSNALLDLQKEVAAQYTLSEDRSVEDAPETMLPDGTKVPGRLEVRPTWPTIFIAIGGPQRGS